MTMQKAVFAGGCFWCIEAAFKEVPGVVSAVSGYMGGAKPNPTYGEVSSGNSGHIEVVEVTFNSEKISYQQLLDIFWRHIDPTDEGGQFADRGQQYQTAIFYTTDEQEKEAEVSKAELASSSVFDKPIVTKIEKASKFYPAEEYHQHYYKKEPEHYQQYKYGSGRETFLKQTWAGRAAACRLPNGFKKASPEDLQQKLSPLQYKVTQENGTEQAFNNEYWDNKQEGIYVDVVSGEPLFSSKDKFDSGTGWPSFTKPLTPENIIEKEDISHGMVRIEVKSCKANSHLGHLFHDGPKPTGQRYCMNSAALRFIPKADLEKEGYGQFKKLFE